MRISDWSSDVCSSDVGSSDLETRERVLDAVARLQYRPNASARSLAGQRSYVIALVYDNPSRNYLMEIQAGVLDACHAHRYNMVLAPVGSGRESVASDIRGVFAHHAPDGVVLIPPLTDEIGRAHV